MAYLLGQVKWKLDGHIYCMLILLFTYVILKEAVHCNLSQTVFMYISYIGISRE